MTNSGWVFNVVTIKVWNHRLTEQFLFHKTIGKELFDKFRKLRFEGQKSIWEHITKRKISTFGSNVEAVTVRIKDS